MKLMKLKTNIIHILDSHVYIVHIDPLLGNDYETNNETTAIVMQ
jgi:hypothetical protein